MDEVNLSGSDVTDRVASSLSIGFQVAKSRCRVEGFGPRRDIWMTRCAKSTRFQNLTRCQKLTMLVVKTLTFLLRHSRQLYRRRILTSWGATGKAGSKEQIMAVATAGKVRESSLPTTYSESTESSR